MTDADASPDHAPAAKPTKGLLGRIDHISEYAGKGAILLAAGLIVLTAVLVVLRKSIGYSNIAMDELRWHFFGASFLLGMAMCLRHDAHVRVDILSGRFGPRLKALVDVVGMWLIAIPACAIVMWFGTDTALHKFNTGTGSSNPQGLPYRWIIRACIPLGFALLALQAFARGWQALATALKKPEEPS